MTTAILSSKYQLVIPKALRKDLNLRPGQRVQMVRANNGDITIKTKSVVSELAGSRKGLWGSDPDAYLTDLRDEWGDHDKRPSSLRS